MTKIKRATLAFILAVFWTFFSASFAFGSGLVGSPISILGYLLVFPIVISFFIWDAFRAATGFDTGVGSVIFWFVLPLSIATGFFYALLGILERGKWKIPPVVIRGIFYIAAIIFGTIIVVSVGLNFLDY